MRKVILCLPLWGMLSMGAFGQTDELELHCSRLWEDVANKANGEPVRALSLWRTHENSCESIGFYHFKIGSVLFEKGEFEEALSNFRLAIERPTNYAKAIKLGIADTHVQLALQSESKRELELTRAEALYKEYIHDYKDHIGYIQLSNLYMMKSDYVQAAEYAHKGVSLVSDPLGFANLIIANQQLGRFKETINAFERAYAYDDQLLSDLEVMVSASAAYAMDGNLKMAKGLLFKLAELKPEVKNNEIFISTVRFVQEKELEGQ